MILVDTSIWVTHLRLGNVRMRELLDEGRVACHSFIIGELACGCLYPRREILSLLSALPAAEVAEHDEVLELIERHALTGSSIGYVDTHLVASALLSHMSLWTANRHLIDVSHELGVAYPS